MYDQIIDANVNRICEGIRVVEEYVRFANNHDGYTQECSLLRKKLHKEFPQSVALLESRDTAEDMRAGEVPSSRFNISDLLAANFKRVQEGLRVLEEYTGNSVCNVLRYQSYDLEKNILLLAMRPVLKRGVYVISDDLEVLEKGLSWNVSCIQLRDKQASKEEIYNKAKAFCDKHPRRSVPFLLNDHLDIAKCVGAEGVHTGQDDMPISEQRRVMGQGAIIGRTTHSLEQGLAAAADGADYISVGPIWETPSKPDREAIGFDYLSIVKEKINIPYVAIGGIDDSRVGEIMSFDPFMVGVIRAVDRVPEWQGLYFKKSS